MAKQNEKKGASKDEWIEKAAEQVTIPGSAVFADPLPEPEAEIQGSIETGPADPILEGEMRGTVEAVKVALDMDDALAQMAVSVMRAVKGGHRPDYVTADGNCFLGSNFYYANEHCQRYELKLYRVVYVNDKPQDIVEMGQ